MLQRSIRRWELVLLFINGVVGAGIFGLPSKVFAAVGIYSIPAYIVCAIAVLLIIFCFAEVSSRFQHTGGPYLYTLHAFGRFFGMQTAWLLFLTRMITYAALVNLFVTYCGFFSPWFASSFGRTATIVLVTLLLATVNWLGIRQSTRLNNVLTIAKLVPLALFIIVGFFYFDAANIREPVTFSGASFSSTILTLIFAFAGFESVLVNTGEAKNPQRNVPMALLTASFIIPVLYMLIQLVCMGTLPSLANSEKPLADAAANMLGRSAGAFIAIGAIISIGGTLNAVMLTGSRLPFAMAEQKQAPELMGKVHSKFRSPVNGLLLYTAATLLVSLYYNFIDAVNISSIARVIIFGIVAVALIVLRKKDPRPEGSIQIPFGNVVAVLAVGVAIWLLSASSWQEMLQVLIGMIPGVMLYLFFKPSAKKSPLA